MKLSELKTGEKGVVVKVSGHGSFRRRIAEMGFVKGTEVLVTMNAPLEDPIEYEVIGYKVSLRRAESGLIEVIGESEAAEEDVSPMTATGSVRGGSKVSANVGAGGSGGGSEGSASANLEEKMKTIAAERSKNVRVALVGNPNCGKTSFFNVASGAHEHVGNYGGVTVDIKEGHFDYKGYHFTLVDLPGTYSISTLSPEELYVRKSLVEDVPDVVINVVDSTNLERNLYLTTQLIDMDVRTIIALNMYDEFEKKGDKIDADRLGQLLGMPVIPTDSKRGRGVNEVFDSVIDIYENDDPRLSRHIHINHGADIELGIERIRRLIAKNTDLEYKYSTRYLAIKYFEGDREIKELIEGLANSNEIAEMRVSEKARVESLLKTGIEESIVDAKYAFIKGALKETYVPNKGSESRQKTITSRIDAIVTNKWAAFPIFFVVLYIMFQCTFTIGQYPMDWIEWLVEKFGELVEGIMPEGWWLTDLLVDGCIGGVGAVLVFLPNILILYFFISLLEDTGYMARAAFIMDRLMHKMGLHGKSFIPMIMGFGCNVPAIMATRSIESRKSRFVTALVIPFMACAGRLPVFVLIAGAFFPKQAGLVMFGLYLFGILLAVLSAKLISTFVKDDDLPFVMELPPYRVPTGKSIFRHTWEKGKQYLYKMGTTILVCSMVIWALAYFPHHKDYTPSQQMESSCIGAVGKVVEPVMAPIGFDWKMSASAIVGIGAKEVVISTLGVIYSIIGDDGELLSAEEGNIWLEEVDSEVDIGSATDDFSEIDVGPDVGDGSMSGGGAEIVPKNGTSGFSSGGGVSNGETAGVATIAGDDDYKSKVDEDEADTALQRALLKNVSPASALSYMVFILLYFPCIATFVAVKNETGKWRWAILNAIYGIVVAWLMSFIVYHIALLF